MRQVATEGSEDLLQTLELDKSLIELVKYLNKTKETKGNEKKGHIPCE